MILSQELTEEDGKTVLENTIDTKDALDMARQVRDTGGRGRNIVPLGFIPPEMWLYDPWLVEARRAQRAGDGAGFTKLVKKFFSVHPAFSVDTGKHKYWKGGVESEG